MTTISQGSDVLTLINVFTVEPAQQQRVVDLLVEATRTVMHRQPGYISANIHQSLDSTRVTNYAQWRSRADFEAMLANPEVAPHMQAITALARFEAHLYAVAFTDEVS